MICGLISLCIKQVGYVVCEVQLANIYSFLIIQEVHHHDVFFYLALASLKSSLHRSENITDSS